VHSEEAGHGSGRGSGSGSELIYEVHAFLHNGGALSFGIFYLRLSSPNGVEFDYGFRFDPPALDPPQTSFTATWTLN
jgi:hypothetical protein